MREFENEFSMPVEISVAAVKKIHASGMIISVDRLRDEGAIIAGLAEYRQGLADGIAAMREFVEDLASGEWDNVPGRSSGDLWDALIEQWDSAARFAGPFGHGPFGLSRAEQQARSQMDADQAK